MEKDNSNSKRHAVFPWQLGFHRNGLGKDAISVKKQLLTLYYTVCTQIQEHIRSYTLRLHLQLHMGEKTHASAFLHTVLFTDTPEVSCNSSITGHLLWQLNYRFFALWGKEVTNRLVNIISCTCSFSAEFCCDFTLQITFFRLSCRGQILHISSH